MIESFDGCFKYKKLTEAEQKQRGILGRLVGPCADFINPTRNSRKYSEKLWENVFENPIMKEKIANRCCFGELNHPADRTETDMEKVAICLAELPKKGKDGKLYGVFDILSTPNGRILKALCDYGCNIGISSRGQGDLVTDDYGEEAVDPDTYECECFDVVLVPGVESARLKYVTESLDRKPTLRQALVESLNSANDSDRKIMEETLKNLNIKLTEDKKEDDVDNEIVSTSEEKTDDAVDTELNDLVDVAEVEVPETLPDEIPAEDSSNTEVTDVEEVEVTSVDDTAAEDMTDEDAIVADAFKALSVEIDGLMEKDKDGEIKDNKFNDALKAVLDMINTEHPVTGEDDAEEVSTEEPVEDADVENTEDDKDVNDADEVVDDIDADSEEPANAEEPVEEALDEGMETLVNSLKEALRGKAELENIVKSLQEKLAVSDAKVSEVNEECNRYKNAVSRLAMLAKSNKDLKENVSKLEESLNAKDTTINEQKTRIDRLVKSRKESLENSASLNESVAAKNAEMSKLTESFNNDKANFEKEIKALNEQLDTTKTESAAKITELNENVTKATALKESYKKLANKAVNKYIEVKADILGVTTSDIKRKLGESYTIEDVDKVCEDLKAYQINVSKLPISLDRKVRVKVNEAARHNVVRNDAKSFNDDDVDDNLIKLANWEL